MIPIGTDIRTRRLPAANIAIIAINVIIFLFTDVVGAERGHQFKAANILDAARPALHQYLTYQFLHGDPWHLVGNMIFLWVFGNAVCDKLGAVCYTLFYLSGGIAAAVLFAAVSPNPMLGASGAIAAVTTAFLVLFPRSRINLLFMFVFITAFELPATVVILGKIVLWDNILAPRLDTGIHSNVAYSAHLAGYLFGFIVALLMLATRAVPRNQFDLLALWGRSRRRAEFASHAAPGGPAPIRTARTIRSRELDSRPLAAQPASPADALKLEVLAFIEHREFAEAARRYAEMIRVDPHATLPPRAQLDLANFLAQTQSHGPAVDAYEAYLRSYPATTDADQVRLLVGLMCQRYLKAFDKAAYYLRAALNGLTQPSQRELAQEELAAAEAALLGGDARAGA